MCRVSLLCAAPCPYKVGYTTTQIEAGKWYLVANGFTPVSGTEEMPIKDLISGIAAGDDSSSAPFVQYWNGTSLETAYFLSWVMDSESGEEFEPGWGDEFGEASHKTFAPGEATWLMSQQDETATFAGAVNAASEKELVVTTNWQLSGNPYPIAFQLNSKDSKFDCSNLVPGNDASDAPFIQYWNGSALETVYFFTWVMDSESGDEFEPGWGDEFGEAKYSRFEPSVGFWIIGQQTEPGTIKFSK